MALDRFMIAPYSTGLENDVKPFLLPEDAFTALNNAYVFRGRVKKRFGSKLMGSSQLTSRLRIKLGTTDGAGDIGVAPAVTIPTGATPKIGQMFSIGSEIFTVYQLGIPGAMLTTGASTVHTYNTTTGAVVIQGAAAVTDLYFYPAEPVMGLITYQIAPINAEELIAFDKNFAYSYSVGGWQRKGTGVWTSSDSQFFWGCSYRGSLSSESYLFVTNNNTTDHVKYWTAAAWADLYPAYNAAGNKIKSAKLVLPFQNRLLLFNVVEETGTGDKTIVNRIRYSQDGDPTAADAFREDIGGKGSWIETTTKEAIISARIIRDRLIVFCESSMWELASSGDYSYPFIFIQLNEELGTESTFSTIIFDKKILGVGNVGIHACNGAAVERIDDKIPLEVFNISSENNGVERVHGVRDYATEMVYWTFVPGGSAATYPRRVLTFNYKNGAFAFNDDSITCFGYYQNNVGVTWADLTEQWQENENAWNTGAYDVDYKNVLAGNQEGFVFIVEPDTARNAPSLQVTNTFNSTSFPGLIGLYVRDHNLVKGDFVALEDAALGIDPLVGIFKVYKVDSAHTVTLFMVYPGGTYVGGATLARVSRISIDTKHYNFYFKEGKNMYVPTVDFLVEKSANGEVTVDVSTSASNVSLLDDSVTTGTLLGTGTLETHPYRVLKVPYDPLDPYTYPIPYETTQARFWHRYYPYATGETIQLKMYLNDTQMVDPDIAWSTFEFNAMVFYANPVTR